MRDPETLPRYFMTGNGAAMVSNRLSHFFDLRGPSVTVDTGCSTALTALHLACQSIRVGDSTMAMVGGVNVMLNPDMFVSMSNLGLLGPDGRSYSFDRRGKGYGRGEGVATILLKPLAEALKDGDPVRAVIRETALNQDGKTPTITSPSQEAQEELIRTCYRNAGLNPADTAYVEAHGTGTATGDPIEAGAIGEVMGRGRRVDQPLLIGSVKSNLGHLEAASGLAAIIKVAMAFEKGVIPPNHNFEVGNPGIHFDKWRLAVPTQPTPWPEHLACRASVSNFGYGGTNAHVILEDPAYYIQKSAPAPHDTRFLFPVSAKDETAARTMIANLADFLESKPAEDLNIRDLAYTLGDKRSRFPWTATASAKTVAELTESLRTLKPSFSDKTPRVGYVFNGQGAQWHAMGRELMGTYPVFDQTLREMEYHLKDFGAEWSLIEELTQDAETTRVNEPRLSMPLSVAIQVALVRLLESWNIRPTAVTGHSSGEISAAFAAGALDIREALAAAYFRGCITDKLLIKNPNVSGAMLAVGLGTEAVAPYLQDTKSGQVVIACHNSPSSVTLSGDVIAIDELEAKFKTESIFARKLQVKAAYHSHHMQPLAEPYGAALEIYLSPSTSFHGVLFSSPVTGTWLTNPRDLGPAHWVENMTHPVLFEESLRNMCIGSRDANGVTSINKNVDMIVEVGPHGALAGPIRQTLSDPDLKNLGIGYGTCLTRCTDAVQTVQTLAGLLVERGYSVDVHKVNFPRRTRGLQVIQLPSYPWNHSSRFWMEPRKNKEYRHRKHAPHDLLGSLIIGTNMQSPSWRHIIRPNEVPWVRDHMVDSELVYPGAGSIVMAIEAVRQLLDVEDALIAGYDLRDIEISKALIIPDQPDGLEVHLALGGPDDKSLSQGWRVFHVYTVDNDGEWSEHCKGSISIRTPSGTTADWRRVWKTTSEMNLDVDSGVYTRRIEIHDFFKSLQAIGIQHGETFQNLVSIRSGAGESVATFQVADTAAIMPAQTQSSHVLHPISLDALFQAAYSAVPASSRQGMGAAIPRSIKKMFVAQGISNTPGHIFKTFSKVHYASAQGFDVSIALTNENTTSEPPVLEISGMHYQSLGTTATQEGEFDESKLCLKMDWVRDISVVKSETFKQSLVAEMNAAEIAVIENLKRATFYIIDNTLAALTLQDIEHLDWHHKILLDWMHYQKSRAERDEIAPKSSKWARTSEGAKQMLFDKVSEESVNGEMLVRIGQSLLGILRKEVAPLQLMLEGKLLYTYYEMALRVDRSLGQVTKLVSLFSNYNPRAKILEIGGGTGACTGPSLAAMSDSNGSNPRFGAYHFTDISSGFFETAREKFSRWAHLMTFSKLDVETDPAEQSFELGSYDLIIACQVLHATKNVEHTMTNVHRLLKPGGKLLMVETTQDAMDVQMVFGTLPGWWLSEEKERKYSPNMSLESWKSVLERTGFTGPDVDVRDCENESNFAMSVIMSTAKPSAALEYPKDTVLVYAGTPPPQSWLSGVKASIDSLTSVTVECLDCLDPAGKVCIFLSELETPFLEHIDDASFVALKSLLNDSKGVLWVTRGAAINCERSEAALHTGLLRTRRLEDNSKRYIALDADPKEGAWSASASQAITQVFEKVFDYSRDKACIDYEYAQRNQELFVPRITDDSVENEAVSADTVDLTAQLEPFIQEGRELRMVVGTPGLLDSLVFKDDPDAGQALPDDFVEIDSKAFGLNFRDIMVAMGQLQEKIMGFECSGVVTRVGPNATHDFKVGDRVCALTTRGHWANKIRIHWTSVGAIPDHMSFETAASIPMVFVTAYYGLFEKASLEKGETVLVHAASGGVGQAAIILAKSVGAEIFVTVGSTEKRKFIRETYGIPDSHIFNSRDTSFAVDVMAATNGRGVDVLLNSLAGEMLQESLNVMATLGRFVEIGKRDIQSNKRLEMENFGRAISFMAVDLIHLGMYKGRVMSRVINECLRLLNEQIVEPIQPITIFPISDIQRAFRRMQAGKHLGKIIIRPNPDDLVKVVSQKKAVRLPPNASYLLVGGLGGIGRSIAQWFVQHGAKNLLILSRSAASQTNTREFVRQLNSAGCKTLIKNCDISDHTSLSQVIIECSTVLPPVKGVVQAAMVLNDSVFEHMDYTQWQTATRPKVIGTQNLHAQFGASLDFFVMLSSATGVLGNTSQANYAAGGTFQDAFARSLNSKGLPAVSIDLGMVKAVGYVAETKGVAERLAKIGYRPLEEEEVLRIIEAAIRDPLRPQRSCQVITGLAQYEKTDDIAWREELRFSGLRRQISFSAVRSDDISKNANSFSDLLSNSVSLREAVSHVTDAICAKLSEMFMIALAEIDTAQQLAKYGVDSLVAVELRNWLVSRMQTEVSIFDILQSASLVGLAEKVASKSKYVVKAGLVKTVE
ncbi:putative polyketide synthase [Amniculicola lignicola CBS 123094]|uniref:Putative polyketide synthase n=1 Tax=Amniculicola lignicola CBS 123094 TaxID=1392246 RepID=A0A6A5W6J2_9PLEO|nr:putative polyketide synthase [Amniculicola lignicola CBS 123094]